MRIGSVADANIKIGSDIYRLKDLYTKTLYAAKDIGVYKSYLSLKPINYIKKGSPIGTIQGFTANGYKGAKQSFFHIGPNTQSQVFVPYAADNFSSLDLQKQGVDNAQQVIDKAEADSQSWYVKLTKNILPYALAAVVIVYLIKKNK